MAGNQLFIRQILLYVIVPVVLALLFIALCYISIQKYQSRVFEQQIFNIVEDTVVREAKTKGLNSNLLRGQMNTILQIDAVHYISVYDQASGEVTNYGLPLGDVDFSWLSTSETSNIQRHNLHFRAYPLTGQRWLISGVGSHELLLNEYKSIFFIVLVSMMVLAFVAYFSTKLHNTVTQPLGSIVEQTRRLIAEQSDTPVSINDVTIYQELIDAINESVNQQYAMADEMRLQSEQSTKELRETLETVEIQNIELDIARKNALQASKAKSEFLANTSHELRTPLNGILGFTSLLFKTGLSNQQRDYLSTIEQSSQGLLTVINDILDFSKLETGQLMLEFKPVRLHEIVEEIFTVYAPQAHEKNLRLLCMIHRSVQQNLLGDAHRIKQIVTNLVTNAIKFSNRGCITVRAASLSETDNQTEIKVTVSDNGIGLTPEQQEQLFTAFAKIDSSDSRLQGGAGLGLAIAKGLINRMQGEIGVESAPNKGSNFWFTMRLGIDKSRPSHSPLHNSLYGINALVYDANDESRAEITRHLSEWGIFYREESSLVEIEKPLSEARNDSGFDIVLLDAYTDPNSFDRDKLLRIIHNINGRYQVPIIVLAPSSIQRILQDDILGLNTVIVQRPIVHDFLHRSVCNQLNIVQPLASPEAASPTNAAATDIKNTRVLVVEDNPANAKLVCEFLKGLGVQVTASDSGYDALRMCESTQFDLIFMDVQMPGIDGLETTRQLREKESSKRTPIIALTAHAVDEQKTRLLLAGMDDYLSKPVSESNLKLMLDRWTNGPTEEPFASAAETPAQTADTSVPEQESSSQATRIFDWSESMQLAKNKPDLATDMLCMLIENIEPTRLELTRANNQKNWDGLGEIAHKFHGGCCYCGVPRLRDTSKELENAAYKHDGDAVQKILPKLLAEMDDLLKWSQEYDLETLFTDA